MKLLLKGKIYREPVVTGLFKLSLEQGRPLRGRGRKARIISQQESQAI